MKNLVLAALFSVSAIANAATLMPDGDAARGKAQLMMCSACHGPDGNSAAPNFPKLAGQGAKYLYKQLMDVRDGNRSILQMTGMLNGKSDQDLADMAAYYASQAMSGAKTDPALLELGQKIYNGGNADTGVAACIACHGPNGKGLAPAGYPRLAGQHADYIAAQLTMYRTGYDDKAGRTNDGDTKIMRATARGLSDAQIKAVASYASGLIAE